MLHFNSVDDPDMNRLLDNQRVSPRRHLNRINETSRFDTWFNHYGDSGAVAKRHKSKREARQTEREKDYRWYDRDNDDERSAVSKHRFMRSFFSMTGFLMLLMVVVLAAGNFDFLPKGWMDRNVITIKPPEGSVGESSTARYAGIASSSGQNSVNPLSAGQDEEADAEEEFPIDLIESFKWINYRVKSGDTVDKIARNHGLSMDAVIASNNIRNVRELPAGKVIKLPNMDGVPYVISKGNTLEGIAKSFNIPLTAILDANDIKSDKITPGETIFIPGARMRSDDLKIALGELFVHPVKGARLSSGFGWRNDPFTGERRFHNAIDLAAKTGTPVRAAASGTVSIVNNYPLTFGKFVIIDHGNGIRTLYAHLDASGVRAGQKVSQGAQIGEVGNTGKSTGPHLHFAVYKNGIAVNPLDFLRL